MIIDRYKYNNLIRSQNKLTSHQELQIALKCQNLRSELDRFFSIANLDKKNIVKRLTKSSQRIDCLSYYLMFHDRNTTLFLHKIAFRDKQS